MNTTQFDEGALLQAGTTAPVRDPVLASLLPRLTPSVVAAATLSLAIAYFLGLAIYRLNFHPCAKYPGPFWCKISPLPWLYHYFRNENVAWVDRLHSEYGPTVRLAPSHLSYIQPTAWKDIYGHKTATRKSNPKDTFAPSIKGAHPLVTIPDDAHHAKRRKIFNNAFSDRALMQQEGLIGKYVDGLVALIKGKIAESPDGKAKVDAIVLTNCVAFDIIGDLTFGEGLGLVETGKLSPWVEAMADNLKFLFALAVLSQIPFAGFVAYMLAPKSMMEKVILHAKSSDERVEKRMQKGPDARPDIWGLVLQQDEEMSREEMNVNASMFMTAGTETTATSMSGILWLLAKNPDKLNKVLAEVRSVPDESHLTADKVRHMKYLCAVIEEGLRCKSNHKPSVLAIPPTPTDSCLVYPAIAFGNFRRTPSGGTTIQGDYLPEKVCSLQRAHP